MNFYRFLIIFYCVFLQSISSAQVMVYEHAVDEDAAFSPHRLRADVYDSPRIQLDEQEITALANFAQFARCNLNHLLSGNAFPATKLLQAYSAVKPILLRLNNGALFHPTPEADRKLARHISAISELSPQQFQHGSPRDYFDNLGCPCGSATFTTPYGNTAIITAEWLTLASILHDNNFEQAVDHSPSSPSGKGNWHHAFQTHNVIHLLARAVHRDNHGALHPITCNSQIDRQAFANERLRLNQAWALLASIRSISSTLKKYHLDEGLSEYLKECSTIYSVPVSSRTSAAASEEYHTDRRTLDNEYDEDDGMYGNQEDDAFRDNPFSGKSHSKAVFGSRSALKQLPLNRNWQ